jgi:NADH-quinone oxidoreductase subunit M
LISIATIWAGLYRDPEVARRNSLVTTGVVLAVTLLGWWNFALSGKDVMPLRNLALATNDAASPESAFVIDELNAPLMVMAAVLFFLMVLATPPTKMARFSFVGTLVAEGILLATFACQNGWELVLLLCLGVLPPWWELRSRGQSTRVYVVHMLLFIGLLVGGWWQVAHAGADAAVPVVGIAMLLAAVLLRSGIAPVHCWMTDLFENASLSTAVLFVTPMVGTYAAVRLVLPIAPDWALKTIAYGSLVTAVYAAGMALVQKDARRFYCYLFLSNSSLVLVGLELIGGVGVAGVQSLAGALSLWLSVGLALGGFGLTLRAIEARTGRLDLSRYLGMYELLPTLAVFFLLTGLASIGFPGTIGFISAELLLDAIERINPTIAIFVAIATALNGIAIVKAYFHIFTGVRPATSISLETRLSERIAVFTLAGLIIGGGLFPQPGVESRFRAAEDVLAQRKAPVVERPTEKETQAAMPQESTTLTSQR